MFLHISFFLFQVEAVAKKTEKPLICQDKKLAESANIDIEKSSALIFDEKLYEKDTPVMMLYLPIPGQDTPQRFLLKHKDLNRVSFYLFKEIQNLSNCC